MTRLVVLGGGKMGAALVSGLLASGWAEAEEILVVEPVSGRQDELVAVYPGLGVVADIAAEGGVVAEGAVVAVKPADVEAACRGL
ncbi:MAG: NAD(P)-binding domain-containing protein, partial [Acidimicrobiales bacterium]|nr:NAD(P)-binding domain-containing protein [Acidimicrobiales bacterium]